MSKREDIKNITNSLVSGFIAPQTEDIGVIEDTKIKSKENVKKSDVASKFKETKPSKAKTTEGNNIISDENDVSYDIKKKVATNKDGSVKTDSKGNIVYTKNDNLSITFKIDADLEDFLKNIEKIAFLESLRTDNKIIGTTRTEFINKLIRQEMYKMLDASKSDTAEDIKNKWLDYKNKNGL